MQSIVKLLANVSLKTKIFGISFVFLTGMSIILSVGGIALLKQNNMLEAAIKLSTERVSAANAAKISITNMDRAIQALIAANEKRAIKIAAIGSIRAGSFLEENLQKLEKSFTDTPQVQRLTQLVSEIRPIQLKIIQQARKNNDTKALEIADQIKSKVDEINQLNDEVIELASQQLDSSLDKAKQDAVSLLTLLGIGLGVGVLLGVIISFLAVRMMGTPLMKIESIMSAVANGDLTQEIDTSELGKDEIGNTLLAIDNTLQKLQASFSEIKSASHSVAGDSQKIVSSADDIAQVSNSLNQNVETMLQSSSTIDNAMQQANSEVHHVSSNAERAATLANESASLIRQSVDQFVNFQSSMEKTASESAELSQIAEKISTITQTITGISEQTNLLALNAAIEAARAGEHGRGFAVVADEVRSLASNTSKAAEEISSLITTVTQQADMAARSMQNVVEDASKNILLLKNAADKTGENNQVATDIKSVMVTLVNIMSQQQTAISAIHNSILSLAGLSAENNQKSDDLHRLSVSLKQASDTLVNVLSRFKLS